MTENTARGFIEEALAALWTIAALLAWSAGFTFIARVLAAHVIVTTYAALRYSWRGVIERRTK